LAGSDYHRKQAEILAALALTEANELRAAELSKMAAKHQAMVDTLDAGLSESLTDFEDTA